MKLKIWRLTILIMLALIGTTAYAMDVHMGCKKKGPKYKGYTIEFKGKKEPVLGLINRASSNPDTESFCNTDVFQFDEKNRQPRFIGNIGSLLEHNQQKTLEEIVRGNCVYTENYMTRKVNYISDHETIGAFIIGTDDKELLNILHHDVQPPIEMQEILQHYKQ